jgi:hypothetical protein
MEPRSKKHVSKNPRQRSYYVKEIKKTESEPTVDDSLKFKDSDDDEADWSISKTKTRRPPKASERVKDHLKENWVAYLVGAVGTILFIFMFDFNRDMGKVEGKVDIIESSVKEVGQSVKELNDKVHNQDLKIQDNQIRLEYFLQSGKVADKPRKANQ